MTAQELQAADDALSLQWDKIQELKATDPLQASILYEKYRKKAKELEAELPPPMPESHIVEDQAVS